MLRVGLCVFAMATAAGSGCGGSLTEPDAGNGQLGGVSGSGGPGGNAAGGIGNFSGSGGITIIDARGADEPCALEVRVMAIADESCRFELPMPPCDYADNSHIGVRIDGVEVPRDPTGANGWDYSDATQRMFTLSGATCDAAIAGGVVTVVYKILV